MVEVLQKTLSMKNYIKLSETFISEMENFQIKKKNSFEFFNGKSNVSKPEDDTKLLLITKNNNNKSRINKLNNNISSKTQSQNSNQLNSTNAITLLKDNVLALFPCDAHMDIFDDIDTIIKIFQSHFRKISKEEIISVLNATSFNIEQAFFDLSNGQKKYCFSNAEDYIIKHMKDSLEFQKLIQLKGMNNVIKREQYLQKNNN